MSYGKHINHDEYEFAHVAKRLKFKTKDIAKLLKRSEKSVCKMLNCREWNHYKKNGNVPKEMTEPVREVSNNKIFDHITHQNLLINSLIVDIRKMNRPWYKKIFV